MNYEFTTKSLSFPERLDRSKGLPDIFEIVKDAVKAQLGASRGGLMLGLAELGGSPSAWIGGFYPVATNVIVMNKGPMNRISASAPDLYKPYVFHILLHEYIHSIGYIDEDLTRKEALEISRVLFGNDHMVTKIAEDITQFFPYITYPVPVQTMSDGALDIEFVKDFDRSSASYIW